MKTRLRNREGLNWLALLLVVLTAFGGLAYIYAGSDAIAGALVLRTPSPGDSAVISGVNLGEGIGEDSAVLTKLQLKGLGDDIIRTQKRSTNYQQVLRLSSTAFKGGVLAYTRDGSGTLRDYLYFEASKPLFELEWIFSPGLVFALDEGEMDISSGAYLNIFGKQYAFVEGQVSGNSITLKLFGEAGSLVFEDTNFNNDGYMDSVEINGRLEPADVRVRAAADSQKVTITSISYRPLAKEKKSADIYIPPKHGIRGYLKNPAVLLSNSFDIIYGGFLGEAAAAKSSALQVLEFKPYGRGYTLIFTNTRGRGYSFPLVENHGGTLSLGGRNRNLIIREGSSPSDYNIALNNLFIVTSERDIHGVTNVLKYDALDYTNGRLFVDDLTGGAVSAYFDKTTNKGVLTVEGYSYEFYVNPVEPHSIAVDMNADSSISSDEVDIVLLGGARLDFGNVGDDLSISLTIPKKLFEDRGADENSAIKITSPGDEVDITLTSPRLELGKSGLRTAMSNFGVLFIHDNGEPADLKVEFPGTGRKATPAGKQSAGIIVVTTKREDLLKK